MNSLQNRLVTFSATVYESIQLIKDDPLLRHVAAQLLRSATSVGANYSEAQSGSSYRDFHCKVRIALKELQETQYWLSFLSTSGAKISNLQALSSEVEELIRIMSTISKKTDPKRTASP
jgi:four helix bundle protein